MQPKLGHIMETAGWQQESSLRARLSVPCQNLGDNYVSFIGKSAENSR